MTVSSEHYKDVFAKQRLFNYGAFFGCVGVGIGVHAAVSAGWTAGTLYTLAFLVCYGLALMSARVRTNPLIRGTIEMADSALYCNLSKWSIIAGAVVILTFIGCALYITQQRIVDSYQFEFTWMLIVQGGVIVATLLD